MHQSNSKKNRLRLLIILNRFVIGGQAVDTFPLAYYLKEEFEILIVYGEKEPDEIEPAYLLAKYPGLRLKKISQLKRSINPLTDIVAFFSLLKTIIQFEPAIVHTHGAKIGILGRLAAFLCGVPVRVHTFHGHFFHSYFSGFVSRLIATTEGWMSKITTAIISLSEAQKNDLVHVFKVAKKEKIHIVPLGFDVAFSQNNLSQRSRFRQQYDIGEDVIAIGIVGRIVGIKNHKLFLEVVEATMHQLPSVPLAFFIIGDGDLKSTLETWLTERSINFSNEKYSYNCKVIFTSWIINMEEIMNGLDIVALTSLNEGTPVTLIEAQYFKKPVVCTNVGGVKDTIEDGKTGFLVPGNNVAAFVDKLKILIENEPLRSIMGEAGQQLVLQRFSKQKEVENYIQFYKSLLAAKNIF